MSEVSDLLSGYDKQTDLAISVLPARKTCLCTTSKVLGPITKTKWQLLQTKLLNEGWQSN